MYTEFLPISRQEMIEKGIDQPGHTDKINGRRRAFYMLGHNNLHWIFQKNLSEYPAELHKT